MGQGHEPEPQSDLSHKETMLDPQHTEPPGNSNSSSFFFLVFYGYTCSTWSSWARGQIGAAAAGLQHNHSNAGPELHLRPTPQLVAMPVP